MSIRGIPFIGKVKEFLWLPLYVTVQKIGSSRAALDVVSKKYYILNPVATTPYVAEAGSTDEVIKLTGHNFKSGDLIRLKSTANPINEFEIVIDSIIDSDTVKLAGYLSASLTAGDTFDALRPVAERVASDGSSLATVVAPPLQYNRKAAGVTTTVSALEDLDTPSNSRALPVVLHGVDAASITIMSNELSIASSHVNDSMAIGDGTRLVGVTGNNEFKTHDADTLTELTTLNSKDFATSAKQDTGNTYLGSIDTKLSSQATAANQATANSILASIDAELSSQATAANQVTANSSLSSIDTKLSSQATAAKQDTGNTSLGNIDANIGAKADTVATTDTGTFSLIALTKRIAQSIAAMSAKLPAALGATTSAASLSVTPATDAIFNVKPKALTNSYAEFLTLTTIQTFVAPTGAIGGKIMASDANSTNVRYKQGGTASATSGMQLQPARSEDFTGGSDITVISESGTTAVMIQWTIQS